MATTSDKQDSFRNAIHQLEEVLGRCSRSRMCLGKVIKDLHLLFKVWPVEKEKDVASEPATSQQTQSDMLPGELAELSLVEKALIRAEKTRSRMNAKLAKEDKTAHSSEQQTSKTEDLLKPPKLNHAQNRKPVHNAKNKADNKQAASTGVIAQGTLNKLLGANSKKPTANVSNRHQPAPVYATAPFQTKTETKKPLKTQYSATHTARSVSKTQSASRATSASSSNSVRPGNSNSRPGSVKTINVKEAENEQSPVMSMTHIVQEETSSECNTPITEIAEIPTPSESEEKKPSVKPFLLAKDGTKVKVPASLGKAASTNFRLRVKLHRQQLKRRVSEANTGAERFLQAMENHNASRLSPEDATVWEQVTAYTNAYTNLHAKLLKIGRNIPTENSCWEDVVSCQRQLGYIMTQWKEMDAGFQELTHVTSSVEKNVHQHHWMASGDSGFTCVLPPDIQARLPCPPRLLRYHDAVSLHAYHDHVHSAQLLLLRLHTLDTLHEPLLTLLHDMQPDSQFYSIYRSAYSLLCTPNGNIFPSVVQDSPEEDDHDENDF